MDTSNRQNDLGDKMQNAAETTQETLGQVNETIEQQSQRIQQGISAATESVQEFLNTAGEKATECAKATDEAIRKHPYQALGVALGLGLLCGYLLKRK